MDTSFELSRVDFRTTPVENIFLDTYLAHAPEEALRVYLAGWKACYSRADEHVEESDLAESLGMSAETVQEAVSYWVNEGLVVIDEAHPDRLLFRSMLLLWAGVGEPTADKTQERQAQVDPQANAAQPSQAEMFDALEDFLSEGLRYRVTLKENELRLILQVMEQYAFSPDYFLYAYKSACQRHEVGSRSVNYVVAVIENWARFEKITTREALDAYFAKADQEKNVRPKRRKRKQAEFAQKDMRMSRDERKAWVSRKLEESRKRSLRGDRDEADEKTTSPVKEDSVAPQTGGEA